MKRIFSILLLTCFFGVNFVDASVCTVYPDTTNKKGCVKREDGRGDKCVTGASGPICSGTWHGEEKPGPGTGDGSSAGDIME